jgi:hypothetical protein
MHVTNAIPLGCHLPLTVATVNSFQTLKATIGLIHVVGLDLNKLDPAQLAWLDADLAAVDRTTTPWIMVSSHFPVFHSKARCAFFRHGFTLEDAMFPRSPEALACVGPVAFISVSTASYRYHRKL